MPKKTTKVAKQKIKQLLQKSRAKAKQGYDDREDERLGMTRGKVAKKDFVGTMKEKEKSRRDDAGFETRKADEMADYEVTGGGFGKPYKVKANSKEDAIEQARSVLRPIFGNVKKGDFKARKLEYGGILQDMTGGVNQDPRFDIYNTGQFGEDGMLVEYADPATKVTPLLAKMAMGGPTEHGLQQGDIILLIKGDYIGVVNDNTGKMATINIATGERTAVERLEDGGVLAKMRPDKIVNQEAREYVENMIDFIGNNLSGLTMSNGDYLVSSFGYYPIWYYDKREKKWYGNTDKFSVTTAKHSSQTRPTYDAVMVSSDTLNEVISRAQDGNRFKRYGGTV